MRGEGGRVRGEGGREGERGGRQMNKVTKKFAKRKQAHVGMKSSKTNQTRRERHHNTFTPSLHLVPFCQNCVFVFVF